MSMFCPECGTEVKEDAKFCPKCGTNINESETENSSNISTDIGNKSTKGVLSFLDDWKEWSTGKKAISIIIVCCIGLLIIGVIVGIIFPDLNTSNRVHLTDSSFALPDGCTLHDSENVTSSACLLRENGDEVFVHEYFTPNLTGNYIDSEETINVDGIDVYKVSFHWKNGVSFTDYLFTKDNIDYGIVFNQQSEPNDDLAFSIVKSMEANHRSSSSNNGDKVDRYDSYTGSTSSNSNDNSNSHSSDTSDNLGDSDVQVRITCKGKWSGSIGVGTSISSYSGKGDKIINLDGSSSDIVSASIQKQSDSNGKLKVEIIKNGKVVKEASTTSAYGVVSLAD